MICPECGTANADTAKFCKGCGSSLKSNRPMETTYVPPNNSNSDGDNKKLVLICATIIICIAIIAATFIMISDNNNVSDGYNNVQSDSNDNVVSDDSSNDVASQSSSNDVASSAVSQSSPDISIKYCDFYTGSSLSDKSYCSANIGTEHYGETYKIGVSYYNGGSKLNDGATATKKVDEEGFLHIYTSNAFDYYPDKATVDIYDANGNFLTEKTYYLEQTSGQQKFDH